MALSSGARLGPYEVIAPLGSGGMGEVYRARDTKLNRDVALKVLPDSFALDADRLARFKREAQVLASLNHPNIAQIYGFEDSGATHALVMELVEGPTLEEKLRKSEVSSLKSEGQTLQTSHVSLPTSGALAVAEALNIARQIAEALEAAHEQGIIHRDLKPANIKVRDDGMVKVLDFGLAKMLDPVSAESIGQRADAQLTASPTITSPAMMTGMGVILGTAAYMSPEQAKGRPADKRSDVWAFGCVLYEMLAGRRPFDAEDLSTTLAAVIMKEPDWTALPSSVPPAIRTLVQRCLEKDRRQRIADISVARFVFAEHANLGNITAVGNLANFGNLPWWRRPLPWAIATLLFAGTAAIATFINLRERPPGAPAEMRVDIVTPTTSEPASFALSPDGRQLALVASAEGASRLWLRPLAGGSMKPLPGTEGATLPFWSPDSRSLGFFADSKIKRIDIDTGRVRTLTNIRAPRGASWSTQGDILFSLGGVYPLYRMPASGGEPVGVTKPDPQQLGHVYPRFLPDGRRFLFFVTARTDELQGIYLGSLDSPDVKRVTGADTAGAFLAPDWLVFTRQTTLFACRFDLNRGVLLGEPVAIADPVVSDDNTGAFSVSSDGLLAYRSGSASVRQLKWFDRSGRAFGTFGSPGFSDPEISPDGKRVAVARTIEGDLDVWLVDSVHETKFTFDPSSETLPLWSPDGARIAFRSNRKGANNIYEKPVSGVGAESPLVESSQLKNPADWSPDGRFLLYYSDSGVSNRDIWVLPVDGDRKPFVWLATPFNENYGQFSPDGHWIAYESDQSGSNEIYISPFVPPSPGSATTRAPSSPAAQFQVSTAGGKSPRWRPDGKELFYIAPSGMLMAAPVVVHGDAIESGAPLALFDPRVTSVGNLKQQYDIAPDGRFLINVRTEDATTALITLLINWKPPAQTGSHR